MVRATRYPSGLDEPEVLPRCLAESRDCSSVTFQPPVPLIHAPALRDVKPQEPEQASALRPGEEAWYLRRLAGGLVHGGLG